jgi:allantoinase
LKDKADFFQVWGGISSCQHAFPLFLSEAHHRHGFDLKLLARLTSASIADRFGLAPHKGRIAVGADADLVVLRLDETVTVKQAGLLYRHQHSPYIGRKARGKILRTVACGRMVFLEGKIVSQPIGRLVKPTRQST